MKTWLKGLLTAAAVLMLNCPVAAQPYACCAPSCCADSIFKGFYIGGNVGFANYSNDFADGPESNGYLNASSQTYSSNDTSWEAGLQIGYDWLCRSKVLGLIVDWDWTNAKAELKNFTTAADTKGEVEARIRWYTTIRGRAGLVISDFLLYLTGGGVVADWKTNLANGVDSPVSFQKNRWGWTAGFGAEFAICRDWSVNGEILYMRFRHQKETFKVPSLEFPCTPIFYDSAWSGRIGLNYHFSLCSLGFNL